MITLVIGGSCSGKSEYAEQCLDAVSNPKIYLATMIASDEESRQRVQRHRLRREGRNFKTEECPMAEACAALKIPKGAAVLLEGIGTLAANELFVQHPADAQETRQPLSETDLKDAKRRILDGIQSIAGRAQELVIVSDEVNRAGCEYEGDTLLYQKLVGELNQELCVYADRVAEMVYGCPVTRKSGTHVSDRKG